MCWEDQPEDSYHIASGSNWVMELIHVLFLSPQNLELALYIFSQGENMFVYPLPRYYDYNHI